MSGHAQMIYGLIGWPVKHSLSPLMHNAAFKALGIDSRYELFELKNEEVGTFLASLNSRGIAGLNVTVPHKEWVIPFLKVISDEARLIGAVNTIKVSGVSLEGYNTDGAGFFAHLTEDLKFSPAAKIIALIGAGGAAKAVAVYLCQAVPKALFIYDNDMQKAESLVRQLRGFFPGIEIRQASCVRDLAIEKADLLINATPVGMHKEDPLLVSQDLLHSRLLVYDLVYNPYQTRLLKSAEEKGCRNSNGLGMLLYQGVRSFELWTGKKAPVDLMRQALNEGVKKLC